MEWWWLLAYLALGGVTGFFAGLLGIGGGGIMVPILAMLFAHQGVAPEHIVHFALGTSMAAIVPTAVISARAHHRRKSVDWTAVKQLTPGVLLGTFATTFIASHLPTAFLATFFAAFMAFISWYMVFGRAPSADRQLPSAPTMFGVGGGIGGVSALVAIGGGSITVPFLIWCNQHPAKAIGTSAAVGLPIALAGSVGYVINGWGASESPLALGYVIWPAVLAMACMSLLSAPLGVKVAHRIPVARLKQVFAVMMVSLAIKVLFDVWGG